MGLGKDHTLFALESGIVVFKKTKYIQKVRTGSLDKPVSLWYLAQSRFI